MDNYNLDQETIYFVTSKARVSTDERLKFMLAYSAKCEPIRKIYEDEFNMRLEKKYRICDLHEDLGTLQPNLEFLDDDGEWVKSGIVKGTVSKSVVGRYRVPL